MIDLVLIVVGLVCGILTLAGVPSRVSWPGLGITCLALAALPFT